MSAFEHGNGYRDPDTFDVRASLRSIAEAAKHHKLIILASCVLTLSLVALYTYLWPPLYVAEATLMAERDADIARDAFYLNWAVFRKDDVKTEIELMTVGPVLQSVVEQEHLTYDDVYHPFMSQVTYIWEKSSVGKTYRRLKTKLFPPDPGAPDPKILEMGRIVTGLRAGIQVDPVGESSVGKLTVKGPSRKVAAVANKLLEVYLASRAERHRDEAQRSYDVIAEQVDVANKELKVVEQRRLSFLETNSLMFDFQLEGLEMNKLAELEGNMATGRTRISNLQASLKAIDQQLASEPATKNTSSVTQLNAVRESMKMRRLELQTSLTQARDRYTEDSPEVQNIRNDLAKMDALMQGESERVESASTVALNAVHQDLESKRDAVASDLSGALAGQGVMEQTDKDLRSKLDNVAPLQSELRGIDRDMGAATEKYQQLDQKRAQAAVALAVTKSTIPSIQIVEYATPPADKYWPKTKILYPAGLILGLFIGILGAMVRSATDGRIRKENLVHGQGAVPIYFSLDVGTDVEPVTLEPRRPVAARRAGKLPS